MTPIFTAIAPGDPIFRTPVKKVESSQIQSPEIQEIIEQLLHTIRTENERTDPQKRGLVGLAASQIGKNYAIIVVAFDVTKETIGDLRVFINAEMTHASGKAEGIEGCHSMDPHLYAVVERATEVVVQALTREGRVDIIDTSTLFPEEKDESVREEKIKLVSRIFQHEIDHCQGKRCADRAFEDKETNLHWIEPSERKQYIAEFKKYLQRKKDGEQVSFSWPTVCLRETWEAMKIGAPYEIPETCTCDITLQSS